MNSFNDTLTRRSVLVRGSQAALALLAAPMKPLLAAPASRWFKIGGCEWMLGKCAPSSLELAQRIGLDGVQLAMGTGANYVDFRQPEVQRAYLKAAQKTGLGISSASLAWTNTMPLKSDPHARCAQGDSTLGQAYLRVSLQGCELPARPGTDRLPGGPRRPGQDRLQWLDPHRGGHSPRSGRRLRRRLPVPAGHLPRTSDAMTANHGLGAVGAAAGPSRAT